MGRVAHNIFTATHPNLYKYFPSDMVKIKQTGNFLFIILKINLKAEKIWLLM